jgi:hypothetical protein
VSAGDRVDDAIDFDAPLTAEEELGVASLRAWEALIQAETAEGHREEVQAIRDLMAVCAFGGARDALRALEPLAAPIREALKDVDVPPAAGEPS